MKVFIALFACIAVASAGYAETYHVSPSYHGPPAPLDHKTGEVIDEDHVAHAKLSHLYAWQKEASRNHGSGGEEYAPESTYKSESHDEHIHAPVVHYHGPPAPLDHKTGQVIDEDHVAYAKKNHLLAWEKEAAKTAHHGYAYPEYH